MRVANDAMAAFDQTSEWKIKTGCEEEDDLPNDGSNLTRFFWKINCKGDDEKELANVQ